MTRIQGQVEQMALQLQDMKQKLENMAKQRDLDIKEFDVMHKAQIAEREIDAAERTPPEDQRAIFSPNA